ncbi:MAG TPA: hypothetical protein VFD48_13165, partial [Pyrinomonadaceae bacterium]|nr:hypothetical protein [Pyrinomonadaceae bacterium]
MHKHPKTSSEALHPSDFKGDKSGSSNTGRQGPMVNQVRAAECRNEKIPAVRARLYAMDHGEARQQT